MGTHYSGKKKEITALNSYIKLLRCVESLNARLALKLAAAGLTESQFSILEAIYHLGPLSQKELGKKLLKSGGNITMVIDNLEKQKLVERKRGTRDRRQFIIHLTDEGSSLIKREFPKHVGNIVDYFSNLNEEEHVELQRICKKLGLFVMNPDCSIEKKF